MKKNIFAFILSLVLAFSALMTGCADNVADTANAPDYSSSNKQFTIWAYGASCNDWYQVNGKRYYFEQGTMMTEEHLQWYKDGGFNLLFVDWAFQENSLADGYVFENGKLKEVMDMAHEKGLKCIVFQPTLHGLSNCEESRINPEKADGENFFESEDALVEYVELVLKGLKDHPAFAGVSLIDEPAHTKLKAIGEIYRAVKEVCPDAYIMENLLPYADTTMHKTMYAEGGADMKAEDAYKLYLEKYYNEIGQYSGYVMYDDYPILEGGLLPTFLYCGQIVSEFASEKGLERRMVFQTAKYSNRRATTEADLWWQLNIGMALGTKDFSYYTYYPTYNTDVLPDETAFIVNRTGERNPRYYYLQEIHKEMQFNAKALMNFEYKGMSHKVKTPLPNGMDYLYGIKNDSMINLKDYTFTVNEQSGGVVLVTELYDAEKEIYGYYVVNVTDPAYTSETVVTLDFGNFRNAQIYQFGEVNNVPTDGGKVTVNLGTGRGAFVMPY